MWAEHIERAAHRLREMKASGIGPSEILGGEAGAEFVRDYCAGDPEVAAAAFTLANSASKYPPERYHGTDRPAYLRSL